MRRSRWLSFLLSAVLVTGLMPAPALAEMADELTEGASEEVAQQTIDAEGSASETVTDGTGTEKLDANGEAVSPNNQAASTELADSDESDTNTAQSEAPTATDGTGEQTKDSPDQQASPTDATLTLEAEMQAGSIETTSNDPTTDALVEGYIERRFDAALPGGGAVREMSLAKDGLSERERNAYEQLLPQIAAIAAGDETSAILTINTETLYDGKTRWTPSDLGVQSIFVNGNWNPEAIDAFESEWAVDWRSVIMALLADCPYELYWFDKAEGWLTSGYSGGTSGNQQYINFKDNQITVYMAVAEFYSTGVLTRVGQYDMYLTADSSTGTMVGAAVTNAHNIANAATGTALEQLAYFKATICQEVDYNYPAAESGSPGNNNPWQLVYVFDNDPATKVVCEGYSKAFKYLCDLKDIDDVECILVTGGFGVPGEAAAAHMWNIVNMDDGNNYLVDVTNCDDADDGNGGTLYSIGYPNYLFMAPPMQGSADTNYFFDCGEGNYAFYYYDNDTKGHFSTDDLTLSVSAYETPAPTVRDIADATVSGIDESYSFVGDAITPVPVVTLDGDTLTKDTDYTVSYSNNDAIGTGTITITGINGYTGSQEVTFTIVAADIAYDQEHDRAMLPSWEDRVERWYDMTVSTINNPDGEHGTYEVTDVTSSDTDVVSVTKCYDHDDETSENFWWTYRAEGMGTATLTVSYLDYYGEEASYSFTVTVGNEVYDVDLWSIGNTARDYADGSTMGLPGQTIVLQASGVRYLYEQEDDRAGFTYAWEVEGDGASITKTTNNDDGTSTVEVTLSDDDQDEWFNNGVWVHVTATKNGQDAEGSIELNLENEYPEIWINETNTTSIDTEMAVGSTQAVTPQVRYFSHTSDTYSLGDLAYLRWDYDENCLTITDSQGNVVQSGTAVDPDTFTLTRLGDWDTDVHLLAVWNPNANQTPQHADEHGHRYENANWHLGSVDANIWFDEENNPSEVFVTKDGDEWVGSVTLTAETDVDVFDAQGDLRDGWDIEWTVGDRWGEDDDEDWHAYYTDESTPDGLSVTIDTGAIRTTYENGDSVNARVRITYNGSKVCGSEWYLEIRMAEYNYELLNRDDMIPGWETWIDPTFKCFAYDADHDHENLDLQIVDVEVLNEQPAEGVADVISDAEAQYDDATLLGWRYEALGHGSAEVQITYVDLDGQQKTHQYSVVVSGDVFSVTVRTDGSDKALPGQSVTVWADGIHFFEDASSPNGQNHSTDGLTYQWNVVELESIEGVQSAVVDQDDPSRLTITFVATPDHGAMLYKLEAVPEVRMSYDGTERARGNRRVACISDYDEIWPTSINDSLPVGESVIVTPEVRRYCADFLEQEPPYEFESYSGATFDWDYDEAQVDITSNGDGTYTIERLSNWPTEILLNAQWEDSDGKNRNESVKLTLGWVDPLTYTNGWVDLPGGGKGYGRGGELVTGWLDLNGAKYWFGEDGAMATGWTDVEVVGKLMHYYFNPASGNLARGTWMTIEGKKYYFRESGNLATGWADINGVKYYFDESGQMLTGWQEIDSKRYYFRASGAMQTGVTTIDGTAYAFRTSGVLAQGWVDWDGKKYYADGNGAIARGTWMDVDGKRYYFRESGSMATGWAVIDNEYYFFRPSGSMATGFADVPDDSFKRYFDAEGHMLTGWQTIDGKTYYFRKSGAMQTGAATIDGVEYTFNDKGVLVS